MKKLIITSTILILFSLGSYAQVGIGARGGIFGLDINSSDPIAGVEFSMQWIGDHEWNIGYASGGNWKFTGIKLFKLVGNPDGFLLYTGPGVGLGLANDQFTMGVAWDVGISLRLLKFLQFTLDYRPEWALTSNYGTNTEFSWANIGLGFRFVLGGNK